MNKLILIALFIFFDFLCECTAQHNKNPQYLGDNYGSFDLDKISFNEKLNTLFSKIPHYILADKESYYDKELKKEIITDTVAFIYSVQEKVRTNEIFNFDILRQSAEDVVSLYQTKDEKFGYVSFSVYVSKTELDNLILNLQKKHKEHSHISQSASQNSRLIQYKEGNKRLQYHI